MKRNFSLNEITKFKYLFIILIAVLVLLVLISALFFREKQSSNSDWLKNKSQDSSEIKDITKALPYIENDYRLSYSSSNNFFIVSYPGYADIDQIELKTVLWFKANTKLTNVKVKYGEIEGITKDYDLSDDIDQILRTNKYYQNSITNSQYGDM